MLVKKDPWNLIEDFYEPEKEFIYFEDFTELKDIISDLSNNFEKYEGIIENAYRRYQDYTVEKIYQYIKSDDDSLITWSNKHV
tara:strand:- start:1342 stop:1590 length:249 start_codon:yes stop_codon:yes gene_type:complete